MFPVRPRPPMPPYPQMPPQRMQGPPRGPFPGSPFPGPPRRPPQGSQNSRISNLISAFQTPEGNLDFEKVSTTVKQMNEIYGQVSPMISKFIKR